jgi:putative transposase
MEHRRRRPHAYPDDTPLFITWHLCGSLPYNLYPPPGNRNAGQAFVWMDRRLDAARSGPTFLSEEAIARIVTESIRYGDERLKYYDLHAFVVMPNHVHLLVHPRVPPPKFLQTLKGYTAREANKSLKRTGRPFWQTESYDHWVRNASELQRIKAYIEANPVKAGLAAQPEAYPWSSAHPTWKPPFRA